MIINNDVLGIADRIKEIDEEYILRLDNKTKRFKVMRKCHGTETEECILPYFRLDERTVRYVRKTRRENLEMLIKEIDEENQAIEINEKYKAKMRIEKSIEQSCTKNYKKVI